ncbi:MAG: hypothetical protein ACTSP6_01425 [Promethearchaeota archaeon]
MGNGPGIASFILGIIVTFLNLAIAIPLLLRALSTNTFPDAMRAIMVGIVILVIAFVGLILGIVGVTGDERKVFAIIGLVLCVIPFIFIIVVIFIVQASTEP